MNPQYPVYIISKGRWESRLTSKALERIGVPYLIAVEPQEYEKYAAVIDPKKILTLPFSNLGLGSIPARNFVWEHAIKAGAERHWILDDNIRSFWRLNRNEKIQVDTGTPFYAAEQFVDRYENVAISGFHYYMFAPRKRKLPPFVLNTRIYSCILIKNDIPYRWRGRYNEDTDLSLRALKDGWCTILFFSFLAYKMPTLTMKGGNTDVLYAGTNTWLEHKKGCKVCKIDPPTFCPEGKTMLEEKDGRYKMMMSLVEQHPDITSLNWKWGRWQHEVNYRQFKRNRLRLKPGLVIPEGVNNFGMHLHIGKEEPRKCASTGAGSGS